MDYSKFIENTTLSDLQNRAIDKLLTTNDVILAMAPGTGKTTTALTAAKILLHKYPDSRCLIVAPKSAREAFKKEFRNRIKERYALISADERIPITNQKFLFVEQSILTRSTNEVVPFIMGHPTIAIIDEAHVLQNPKSAVSQCLNQMRSRFAAEWALSGSPLLNSIEGLYNFCKHVDPKGLPNWWEFRDTYCVTKKREIRVRGQKRTITEIIDYKNLESLREYLNTLMVIGSIPYNIKYHRVRVPLDPDLFDAYNKSAKGVIDLSYLSEKDFGARLHDLQRVVDGSHHLLKSSRVTSKEKALLFSLKKIISKGESALVYTEYEDTVSRLYSLLSQTTKLTGIRKIHVMDGSTKEIDRVYIESHLSPYEVCILTQAGKQSRNLQRANHLVLYNTPFSIGNFIQLIGRICRMDSQFPVQHVYMIECIDTIDSYRIKLFYDNISLINQLFSNMGVLPLETIRIDRDNLTYLKRRMLWNKRK